MWYSVGSAAKYHHYKRVTTCTRFSPPLQIWDISLPCSCVLCRVLLRWINTYYLCAVFVPGMYGYCLSVDISVKCFIVFIQSFMFRYAHSGYCYTLIGYYIDSALFVYGRFFTRVYLYIG